jgi:hypothetical protein
MSTVQIQSSNENGSTSHTARTGVVCLKRTWGFDLSLIEPVQLLLTPFLVWPSQIYGDNRYANAVRTQCYNRLSKNDR